VECNRPDTDVWAEMLARIGEKHSRLSRVSQAGTGNAQGVSVPRRAGSARTTVLEEIEKERARIARELHAGAGQPLAGIKINLEVLDAWSESMPDETREAVARLNRLAEAALGQVRAVSHRLHPPEWQELSVSDALGLLVHESGIGRQCEIVMRLDPLPLEPPHSAKVVLYRCAQECISNVLRHSGASRFSLELGETDGMVRMTIGDNGSGIAGDALKNGGIGLLSIREHIDEARGILKISSGPDGTTVEISLPLTED